MVWKILSPFVLQKKWEHLRVDQVGTSPVVQWLGAHLPMPRTQVWSPVRELRSRVPQSSWACVLWSPHATSREPTPRSWRSPWAATKTQPATKNRRVGQVTALIRKVLRIRDLTSSQERFSKTMEEWPPEASEIPRAALPLQTLRARAPEEWFQRMGPTPRLRQSQGALTPCCEVGSRPRAAAGTVPSRPAGTWPPHPRFQNTEPQAQDPRPAATEPRRGVAAGPSCSAGLRSSQCAWKTEHQAQEDHSFTLSLKWFVLSGLRFTWDLVVLLSRFSLREWECVSHAHSFAVVWKFGFITRLVSQVCSWREFASG